MPCIPYEGAPEVPYPATYTIDGGHRDLQEQSPSAGAKRLVPVRIQMVEYSTVWHLTDNSWNDLVHRDLPGRAGVTAMEVHLEFPKYTTRRDEQRLLD